MDLLPAEPQLERPGVQVDVGLGEVEEHVAVLVDLLRVVEREIAVGVADLAVVARAEAREDADVLAAVRVDLEVEERGRVLVRRVVVEAEDVPGAERSRETPPHAGRVQLDAGARPRGPEQRAERGDDGNPLAPVTGHERASGA